MIEIILAGPPMGKERVKQSARNGEGHAYTPEKTVRWESRMAFEAQHVMAGKLLLDGPLCVEIVAIMPVPKSWSAKKRSAALLGVTRPTSKPDWDNCAKLLDALNLIVWVDDAIVVQGHVEKWYGAKPMTAVRVWPWSGLPKAAPPTWVHKHMGW